MTTKSMRRMRLAGIAMTGIAVTVACAAALRGELAPALAAGHAVRARHVHAAAQRSGAHHSLARKAQGQESLVVVSVDGPVRTLAEAMSRVRPHGLVTVRAGVYVATTPVLVRTPVHLIGEAGAVLDAMGAGTILDVVADSVRISGFTLRNVGTSHVEDRAAIRVARARACVIDDNRIEDAFFGIYLDNVDDCEVRGNDIRGHATSEATAGNGIHLWSSRRVRLSGNRIRGHRDGIYLEFAHDARVEGNLSTANLRYGLHFMYSNDCRYEWNTFLRNGAGVAVMFTKHVTMRRNHFGQNWGPATYGLLLKEITDSRVDSNVFARNTIGLHADGATRLGAEGNVFRDNGWAVRLGANTEHARFVANTFLRNTFDVTTTGGVHTTTFTGNTWDTYRGYDLDRDGIGDVPHHPVRLFSMIVERDEPSLVLLRSGVVALLDAAERVLPSLTPAVLADSTPTLRRTP